MLAERTVRRLSIRAPADALARRAGLLIEDALRTASLPGDGAELLLLRACGCRRSRPQVSPQQVALRLEAACRAAIVVDGRWADDAALGAAPAVRFADALMAHLSLTRLILAGSARQAWCWPLLVKGYRPAFGRGAALRALALSLAALPEAPAALPRWIALLVADGDAGCCSERSCWHSRATTSPACSVPAIAAPRANKQRLLRRRVGSRCSTGRPTALASAMFATAGCSTWRACAAWLSIDTSAGSTVLRSGHGSRLLDKACSWPGRR
jgi:hypothetical protein